MVFKFVKGAKYRHTNCLDVDIIAASHFYTGTDYVTGKVWYYNRNYDYVIDPKAERIKIKKEDLKRWNRVY